MMGRLRPWGYVAPRRGAGSASSFPRTNAALSQPARPLDRFVPRGIPVPALNPGDELWVATGEEPRRGDRAAAGTPSPSRRHRGAEEGPWSPGSGSSPGGLVPNARPRGQDPLPCLTPRLCPCTELPGAAERGKNNQRRLLGPATSASGCVRRRTAPGPGTVGPKKHDGTGGTQPLAPQGRVGRDGDRDALAEHRPSLRYPQQQGAAGPARCPGPSGTKWGARGSLPLHPPSGSYTLGWAPFCPLPCAPLPRQEATHCGGCGQEGSHRGDFLTLSFARNLRAAAYAAQEPRPGGTALPGTRSPGPEHTGASTAPGTTPTWGAGGGGGGFAGSGQPSRGWGWSRVLRAHTWERRGAWARGPGAGRRGGAAMGHGGEGAFIHTPGEMPLCLSFPFILPRKGRAPPGDAAGLAAGFDPGEGRMPRENRGERHMWGKVLPYMGGGTPGGDTGTPVLSSPPPSLQRPPWPRWARTPR